MQKHSALKKRQPVPELVWMLLVSSRKGAVGNVQPTGSARRSKIH